MTIYLVNPSELSFGIGVITPRWLYVLAAATPERFGDPIIVDETLERMDISRVERGDVVGIGIHTLNALYGYALGRRLRDRGAYVVFGGIHASLFPEEAHEFGGAHAVVKGDGDAIWEDVLDDCARGSLRNLYDGGRVPPEGFRPARWDLLPRDRYMWASVQTVRGCPKHCSFCSVWRTDGQRPRQPTSDFVVDELVRLRRLGFRFVALADDNFYPVTLEDLRLAARQGDRRRLDELTAVRQERFELMERLSQLPRDMIFLTQITMEAAEDPAFLDAMRRANIKGALVGVESITPEGLKSVYKNFNASGRQLVDRLRVFREHGVHVLGSFIFGLPTDKPETFAATALLAEEAEIAFAQFVILTPFPGTIDFRSWEQSMERHPKHVEGVPLTRYWLIPRPRRPRLFAAHPFLPAEEISRRTQDVWDRFYSIETIWKRSRIAGSLRARFAFLLISKLYRQMYANTGFASDSARADRAAKWARWIARSCRRLFMGAPMPGLRLPSD